MILHLKLVSNGDEVLIYNTREKVLGYFVENSMELGGRWYSVKNGSVICNGRDIGDLLSLEFNYPVYYSDKRVLGISFGKDHIDLIIREAASQKEKVLMIISEITRYFYQNK
eukprot:NODE_407_length_9242_cov_0.441868.p7 type:complete len:112 gc:universal NODE_407_length_9242_cov_0.441868:1172-837(-)